MIRAADPLRFGLGGHRGGGGPAGGNEAAAEEHILEVQEEHMARVYAMLTDLHERQRLGRNRFYTEIMYAKSASRAEVQQPCQDQFRITYIYAEAGTPGGTIFLKGGQSTDSLALTIPPNTQPPIAIPLGDPDTGGVILEPKDLRYVTTKDGSSQMICVILAGERLASSYLS